jgi:hypothetical protein
MIVEDIECGRRLMALLFSLMTLLNLLTLLAQSQTAGSRGEPGLDPETLAKIRREADGELADYEDAARPGRRLRSAADRIAVAEGGRGVERAGR